MDEAGWEQHTGIVAESHQWWHRSNLTLHISSAAAFWPEEVILQWNICLIPEHWLDASSNIQYHPHPYPQHWSHISVPGPPQLHISAATSFPLFMLPALCSPASIFQSTPNPCCRLPFSPLLHTDPNPHLWVVSSFPSPLNYPWKWRKGRLSFLVVHPGTAHQEKKLLGKLCSSCSALWQRMLTMGCVFGEFICQTQVVFPQVSHNVPCQVSRPYEDFPRLS